MVNDKTQKNENSDAVTFEEDGETIQMEIDDGSAAAHEFASEGTECETENSESSSSETESESEEDGEITELSEETRESLNESVDSQLTGSQDLTQNKKRKGKCRSRKSFGDMENKIDTLSNTLLGLQEIIKNKSFTSEPNEREVERQKDKTDRQGDKGNLIESTNSDTTIYHNALEKLTDLGNDQVAVDPEISFKNPKCDSFFI